jgi:hypothetical protein
MGNKYSMNRLMLIQVNEIDGEPTDADIEKATVFEQTNPLIGKSRRFLENFDRESNEKVFNSVLFRNKLNGVSATLFVRSLMRILESPDDADAYVDSAAYLPSIWLPPAILTLIISSEFWLFHLKEWIAYLF